MEGRGDGVGGGDVGGPSGTGALAGGNPADSKELEVVAHKLFD